MKQEDIIRMAREADPKANLSEPYCLDHETRAWLERFAELVAAAERPWVDLTDTQIQDIYYKVVNEHRGVPMPHGQVLFGRAVQARLKELNT